MPGRLTKNDAVNILLRALSLPKVEWADADTPPVTFGSRDERDANDVIDEWTRDVQDDRNYQWNWVEERTYTTDVNEEITLEENVARVDYTDTEKRPGDTTQDRITERNGRLYNVTKEVFTFGTQGTQVRLKVTYWANFEDLPHAAKRFVVESSRLNYLIDKQRAPEVIQWATGKVALAKAAMERDDEQREEPNILNSPDVRGRMLPRQPILPGGISG